MKKIQLKDYDESYGIFIDLENVENKGYEYKNEMKVEKLRETAQKRVSARQRFAT